MAALSFGACSLFGPGETKPPLPVAVVRTATMDITPGVKVLARIDLPPGFEPSAGRPPMWLENGTEVAVIGKVQGRTGMYGYSGAGWRTRRLIAADGGPGARDGVIVDAAANQNGMTLAFAVYRPKQHQLAIVTRDLIASDGGHRVTSFDGEFASVSVGWLNPMTIALALRNRSPGAAVSADRSPGENQATREAGLYVIDISGMVTAERENVKCPLSYLTWGPRGIYAVGRGDAQTAPILLDRRGPSCVQIFASAPLQLLDWSSDGSAFLYAHRSVDGIEAVFRYDTSRHVGTLVAVSSRAAVFTSAGDVLALGSSTLTFPAAKRFPMRAVPAQLALSHAGRNQVDVTSLGFDTTPALLAESTMAYSRPWGRAAIDTFIPARKDTIRRIVTYSLTRQAAFVVAYGPARGRAAMSWSPGGHYLAIVDGDAAKSALTIIRPPG